MNFYQQLQQLKKMGSLESVLKMIPGVASQMRNVQIEETPTGDSVFCG